MAAQTLIERISGTPVGTPTGAAFRRRVIAPRLILRESTAAFAGARRGAKAA
jgi:LacI family transcriptional regulator